MMNYLGCFLFLCLYGLKYFRGYCEKIINKFYCFSWREVEFYYWFIMDYIKFLREIFYVFFLVRFYSFRFFIKRVFLFYL